ncbi:hypothetical protein [Streptomyces sp. MA15]|uniref:hypothetical protein n=1 Tax=Streptomyces sp. MA15 TaxID=3055061 RepID=UPI0025B093C4|nr:hypothetical protein [Streptomyces sp. MA15]MDN3272504.1 hypothetical protein [Streptomyces sp. MA15]
MPLAIDARMAGSAAFDHRVWVDARGSLPYRPKITIGGRLTPHRPWRTSQRFAEPIGIAVEA